MKHYWYFIFVSHIKTGQRVCVSSGEEFDLCEMTKILDKVNNEKCIITYWHEISAEQYEKMKEYLENDKK